MLLLHPFAPGTTVTCRAGQDGLVPREVADAGQPAIRLHEIDRHPGQTLVEAGLEGLDVPAVRGEGTQRCAGGDQHAP